MGRPIQGKYPSSKTVSRYVRALGKEAKDEYFALRDGYKVQGLTPKEAYVRAMVELNVVERWQEFKSRQGYRDAAGRQVALTPREMKSVVPTYRPLGEVKAEEIGDADMALSEQVKWAMKEAARVQNGGDVPKRFPCEGALFWYQSAVGNRREFEKLLLRVEAPGGDPDNLYLQDSQHQYSEIEKQIRMALDEVGPRLREIEKAYLEEVG